MAEKKFRVGLGVSGGIAAFKAIEVLRGLQEAGCEDEQVLAHARGPGPHVRGCWLVDMVLERFA